MHSYRMNTPKVVAETIDNESVVINLDKGTYYSIRGTGSELWDALRAGIPVDVLMSAVATHAGDEAAADVAKVFVAKLIEEELLVPDDRAAGPGGVNFVSPYSSPDLVKYSDMEALLLLDPIHDVDEVGWPAPA
jgi:hypothetical protein